MGIIVPAQARLLDHRAVVAFCFHHIGQTGSVHRGRAWWLPLRGKAFILGAGVDLARSQAFRIAFLRAHCSHDTTDLARRLRASLADSDASVREAS